MLTTLRACPGPNPEQGFLQVLNQADNYTVRGDTLLLNVGRRAPLAVFHAVYF
jgi:heat shock protein HslJ